MPVKLPVKDALLVSEVIPTAGSTKASLIDKIPLKLVLTLAAPYIAGRTSADAIHLGHKLFAQEHFTGTLDILGEDSKNIDDCLGAVNDYKDLIDAVCANPLLAGNPLDQLSVSLKPSMFCVAAPAQGGGSDPKLDDGYERIKSVVDYARQNQVRVTLEAEDHRWTDFHLESYFSLINEGYTNLGTVVQSRLFRSRSDIKRFDERMRVRMVIGIYNESAEIAHTEKPVMKDVMVELATELLHSGTYVELASHDTACIGDFIQRAVLPSRISPSKFETQFLLGVPRKKLQRQLVSGQYFADLAGKLEGSEQEHARMLSETGVRVRLYLPFGSERVSGPYCRRRLKANPNMIGYGIKNLLHIE